MVPSFAASPVGIPAIAEGIKRWTRSTRLRRSRTVRTEVSAMPPTTRGAAFLVSLSAISACVSQSAIRGPAAQFSQATLTAVSAEQALLDDVDHAAESAKTALLRARWNSNHQSFQPEDMIPPS